MVTPLARTSAEAHLYLELHGCDCGERAFTPETAVVVLEDGELGSRYTYDCPRCGTKHEITFRLPADPTPPGPGLAYGGAQPSELLDAGEWLAVADAYASQAPADPAGLSSEAARRARTLLTRATAALDEVLKFVPAGADAVPESAFFTGGAPAEPGRFHRNRLTAVRNAYAGLVEQL